MTVLLTLTVVMKALLPPEVGEQKTPPEATVDVFLPRDAASCTLQQVLFRSFSNFMFQVYKRKMKLKDFTVKLHHTCSSNKY